VTLDGRRFIGTVEAARKGECTIGECVSSGRAQYPQKGEVIAEGWFLEEGMTLRSRARAGNQKKQAIRS